MERAGDAGVEKRVGGARGAGGSPREAVARFTELVQGMHESQYGDFMRRANVYLTRLEHEMGAQAGARVFDEIRMRLIFRPNFDVESTRRFLVERAQGMLG